MHACWFYLCAVRKYILSKLDMYTSTHNKSPLAPDEVLGIGVR
jgi:hypothetical protein